MPRWVAEGVAIFGLGFPGVRLVVWYVHESPQAEATWGRGKSSGCPGVGPVGCERSVPPCPPVPAKPRKARSSPAEGTGSGPGNPRAPDKGQRRRLRLWCRGEGAWKWAGGSELPRSRGVQPQGLAPCPALYLAPGSVRASGQRGARRQANSAGSARRPAGRVHPAPSARGSRGGDPAARAGQAAAGCCEGGQQGQQWRIFMKALRNSMLKVV